MDDEISRQAAIKIIKNYCENGCDIAEDNWCPSCQREQFIKLLEALPPAQSERKTGKYHDPFGNPIYVYVRVGDKTVAIKADDLQKALDYVTEHGEEVTIEGRREVDGM